MTRRRRRRRLRSQRLMTHPSPTQERWVRLGRKETRPKVEIGAEGTRFFSLLGKLGKFCPLEYEVKINVKRFFLLIVFFLFFLSCLVGCLLG